MLNAILECHVAGPHALSHEVSAFKWRHDFMRMRFSRSIIYTWGWKKRVCKRVRVFALICMWEWSNFGHNV